MADNIIIGGGGESYADLQHLLLSVANRHGLIAGATGTGKTVTLQILAEGFSSAGVPVFLSDIKGDVSGVGAPGSPDAKPHESFAKRAELMGIDLAYRAFPVTFWDLFGQQGHPVRTTVAEMGPLLLSRLMGLTDVQEGVLNVAFKVADEQGLPLLDLEDLQALLQWCGQNARDLSLRYGNVTSASVGAIQTGVAVKTDSIETAQMLIDSGFGERARYLHRSWLYLTEDTDDPELHHRLRTSYLIIRAGLPKKVQATLGPLPD